MTAQSTPLYQGLVTLAQRGFRASLGALLLLATASSFSALQAQEGEPQQTQPPISSTTRFSCEFEGGEYVVMYSPESQPNQRYPWAKPTSLGGGWSADRRCAEISRRLESYRPDGLLEMQTSTENGYNIICVTTQQNPNCRIVLTVPPGEDPLLVRNRVFENLTVADSGQQTDAVNTYRGNGGGDILRQIGEALDLNLPNLSGSRQNRNGINLRPFLDAADGGTGTQLNHSGSQQLNPDRFR